MKARPFHHQSSVLTLPLRSKKKTADAIVVVGEAAGRGVAVCQLPSLGDGSLGETGGDRLSLQAWCEGSDGPAVGGDEARRVQRVVVEKVHPVAASCFGAL